MNPGTVYLIHLENPIAHAQHYIGWSRSFKKRLDHHRKGTGSKFLAEAVRRNINFDVVRKWTNARLLCPECREERLARLHFTREMRKFGVKQLGRAK